MANCMSRLILGALVLAASFATPAVAGFGELQYAFDVRVTRFLSGPYQTYVEFTSLPGCNASGGYLSVTWPEANGGSINEARAKQIVATLLFAKATDNTMQVWYRLNTDPHGFDSCAIETVFLN